MVIMCALWTSLSSTASAIKLLLFTGCRRNEVLSLKWDQVRFEEGRIFLPDTKNGRSRSVLLNAKAREILEGLRARKGDNARTRNSDYIFPSRAGTRKGYRYDLRKPFEAACTIAGIEGLRIHDLRHSFATLAIMGGGQPVRCPKTSRAFRHCHDPALRPHGRREPPASYGECCPGDRKCCGGVIVRK
jgi:integrase